MKPIVLTLCATLTLCGCAASGPTTSWGKEGVTMLDYRSDGAQCAVIATREKTEGNGANTAGGMNGQNQTTRLPQGGSGDASSSSGASSAAFPTGGGGAYRDNSNVDTVSRAATQSQAI